MIERLKKYLVQQFRLIAPSKEAMEYRQEVLANLLDRAHEYKIKGMTDEDAIYDLCIDSLGDFKSTLKDFESRVEKVKKAAPKIGAALLATVCTLFFMAVVYLIVSFVTEAWAQTWLIMVGGVFLAIIILSVAAINKLYKKNKLLPIRIFSQIILVLTFVMLFLILQIVVKNDFSWITFLFMVIGIFITDTTLCYLFNSKMRKTMLVASIEVISVMIYVILGVTYVIPWHPYWLIPVIAFAIDLALVALFLKEYSHKNEMEIENKKKIEAEDYYTMW